MNLDNPSNTVELRALIAEIAGVSPEVASNLVKALHRNGYGVVHAQCSGCRDIHPSYPSIRAYHHPLCKDGIAGICRGCGKSLGHKAVVVGEVCGSCAYGNGE